MLFHNPMLDTNALEIKLSPVKHKMTWEKRRERTQVLCLCTPKDHQGP